jgi:predicted DNA-binding transcriptional regulator YafY
LPSLASDGNTRRVDGEKNDPREDGARRPGRPRGKLTQVRKVTRLQQLLVQFPKGLAIAEIAEHLRVDPRSARRYVEALKSELRIELEPLTDGTGTRRWRIPDVDVPRRVAVRRTQAYALLAARPLFAAMRGSTVYEEIALAAESLLGLARRPGRGPNAGFMGIDLEARFRYVAFAPKDFSPRAEDLDNLFQAVADLRPVSLLYPDIAGMLERVELHPYALLLYKESIYVLGNDTAQGHVRTIELDFVRDSQLLDDQHFELPRDFDVNDYVQGQFGLWRAHGTLKRVVIDFDRRVAAQVATRRFHPTQQLCSLPEGGLRLTMQLGDTSEVAAWVLGFGPLAVVREPIELRSEVERSLSEALDRYREGNLRPSVAPDETHAPTATAPTTKRSRRVSPAPKRGSSP